MKKIMVLAVAVMVMTFGIGSAIAATTHSIKEKEGEQYQYVKQEKNNIKQDKDYVKKKKETKNFTAKSTTLKKASTKVNSKTYNFTITKKTPQYEETYVEDVFQAKGSTERTTKKQRESVRDINIILSTPSIKGYKLTKKATTAKRTTDGQTENNVVSTAVIQEDQDVSSITKPSVSVKKTSSKITVTYQYTLSDVKKFTHQENGIKDIHTSNVNSVKKVVLTYTKK